MKKQQKICLFFLSLFFFFYITIFGRSETKPLQVLPFFFHWSDQSSVFTGWQAFTIVKKFSSVSKERFLCLDPISANCARSHLHTTILILIIIDYFMH